MAGLDPAIHALPPPFARLDVYLTSTYLNRASQYSRGWPGQAGHGGVVNTNALWAIVQRLQGAGMLKDAVARHPETPSDLTPNESGIVINGD
jgi:hypothetical protein